MMDCQHALELLQDILDKEASQIDEKEVRAHLNKCRHCFEKFRLEESVQAFLNEKMKVIANDSPVSPKVASLKNNILTKLDEIDHENGDNNSGFFNTPTKIIVSIAALIVFVGMGFLTAGFYRHNEYYIPFEKAHWTAKDQPKGILASEQYDSIVNDVKQKYNLDLTNENSGYVLTNSHKEIVNDIEFEHILYTKDDDCISVMITSDENFEIPPDIADKKQIVGDTEIYDHNCRGCRVVFHKIGSLVMITASINHQFNLLEFSPRSQPI